MTGHPLSAHCPGREQAHGALLPDRRRGGRLQRARAAVFDSYGCSNGQDVFLIAFDLLELDGKDLRREPLRDAQADAGQPAARMLCRGCSSMRTSRIPATSCSSTPARWGSRASCRSGWARAIAPVARSDWLKFKNPEAPAVKREAEEDWGRGGWR